MKRYLSRKARDLVIRVDFLTALSSARRVFKNAELSHILNSSEATLSKYYHGITIPATPTAEHLLRTLLSDEFARKCVGRFMNKTGWDLRKAFAEPLFTSFVALYFKYKLLGGQPGLFIDKLLSLPDYSLSIASYLSTSLEVPLIVTTEEGSVIGLETGSKPYMALQKSDYVISVHAILNKEIADYFKYVAEIYDLKHVAALTVVLMDENEVSESLRSKIHYLIP